MITFVIYWEVLKYGHVQKQASMGRPQDPERVAAKLAEVSLATMRTIAKHGIEGTSLRTIASEGGFTTGTLVYYFRNKQDILLFAGRTVLQGLVGRIHEKVSVAPSLSALENALADELPTNEKTRLGWTIWLAFTAQAASVPAIQKEHAVRSEELRKIVLRCLAADASGDNTGQIADSSMMVFRLLSQFDGLGIHALLEPNIYPAHLQRELLHQAIPDLQAEQTPSKEAAS